MTRYAIISTEELTIERVAEAVFAKDNFCLNLVFQALVHGQIDPLNRMDTKALRSLNLVEFRKFIPAKFNAKECEWTLDKEARDKLLSEFQLEKNNGACWVEFCTTVMNFIIPAREEDIEAETAAQAATKETKARKLKENKEKKANRIEAVGKVVEREMKRGTESLPAEDLLTKVLGVFNELATPENQAEMLKAMATILETKGYATEAP